MNQKYFTSEVHKLLLDEWTEISSMPTLQLFFFLALLFLPCGEKSIHQMMISQASAYMTGLHYGWALHIL